MDQVTVESLKSVSSLCKVVMTMWQNGTKSKGTWTPHPPAGIGWLGFHVAQPEVRQHQKLGFQRFCGI